MCFSAEADLVAGVVVTAIGIDAIQRVHSRKEVPLAALPLLFGVHTLIEAFVWWGLEGKVPAAWFLEQVGAKGMRRGQIQVAAYHANLVYNDGAGTAADLCALVDELKTRVRERFGIVLEEEVQFVGIAGR